MHLVGDEVCNSEGGSCQDVVIEQLIEDTAQSSTVTIAGMEIKTCIAQHVTTPIMDGVPDYLIKCMD